MSRSSEAMASSCIISWGSRACPPCLPLTPPPSFPPPTHPWKFSSTVPCCVWKPIKCKVYGLHSWSSLVSLLTPLSLVYFKTSQHKTHSLIDGTWYHFTQLTVPCVICMNKLMLVQCFAVQQSSSPIQSSNPVRNPVQWLDTTDKKGRPRCLWSHPLHRMRFGQ